jgi:hypothetical protein
MSERDSPLDRFLSIIADVLQALRAGAGIRPLGSLPDRLTFTTEERELLDRLTRDTPDVVQSMAADVADAFRQAAPAVQPLLSDARDVDCFLVALVDQVVDRELRAGDPWGADEPARRRLLDLLLGTAWPSCARRSRRGARLLASTDPRGTHTRRALAAAASGRLPSHLRASGSVRRTEGTARRRCVTVARLAAPGTRA